MEGLQSASVPMLNFAYLSLGRAEGPPTVLGIGGSARVYRGLYRGSPVAVKLIFLMELTPMDVSAFVNEAAKLHSLNGHTNVVSLIGVCIRPPALALVMELCAFGSLYDVLHAPRPGDPDYMSQFSQDSMLIGANKDGNRTPLLSADGLLPGPRSQSQASLPSAGADGIDMHSHEEQLNLDGQIGAHSIPLTIRNKLIMAWQTCKGIHSPFLLSPIIISSHVLLLST
jgi:hypothetical protein